MKINHSSTAQEHLISLIDEQYNFLMKDPEIIKIKQMIPPVKFAWDFGSLIFKGRRGLGLTWLAENIFLLMYTPSLIIAHNEAQTSFIKRQISEFISSDIRQYQLNNWIFPISWFKERPEHILCGVDNMKFKLCLLDNASHFTEEEIDLVFATLIHKVDMFTLLG